nr:Putative ATP phosphoribosyl transferase [Oryza sativa Japonica Group]
MARTRFLAPRAAASAASAVSAKPAAVAPLYADRTVVRIGLPSKGRMSEQTLSLLKSCQLSVRHLNPRQYTADIPQVPNLEVWFQRPKDIVRKLQSGDLDLGIVGFDIVSEYGQVYFGN